jgi:hypothetical protein
MARGRPPAGPEIVNNAEGSEQARKRMQVFLQTISGELTVAQACEQLGLSEARFRELREQIVQAAVSSLEPKAPGRPPQQKSPEQQRIEELEAQVQELKIDLRASQIRAEIALVMPHLLKPSDRHERLDALQDKLDLEEELQDEELKKTDRSGERNSTPSDSSTSTPSNTPGDSAGVD